MKRIIAAKGANWSAIPTNPCKIVPSTGRIVDKLWIATVSI